MGFQFGGFIALHRGGVRMPLTHWQRVYGPEEDLDIEDSLDVFVRAVHRGRWQVVLEETSIDDASARGAKTLAVTTHDRCVLLFDRSGVLSCDAETPGAMSTFDHHLAALTAAGPVASLFVYWLDGTSDSYFFSLFERGARVRRWASLPTEEGELTLDEGSPLETEPAGPTHGEERVDMASRALLGDRGIVEIACEHDAPVYTVERNFAARG